MKKLFFSILILVFSFTLYASELDHSLGLSAGLFMNFGSVALDNRDANALVVSAGPAISPVYDMTVDNGKVLTYGLRARTDLLIGVETPKFFEADLFIGPKGTIAFNEKARLNLAIGAALGYSMYENAKADETDKAATLSWGFGPDLYFDYDITENFGMGIGYIGKIGYDFDNTKEDRALLMSSDVYLSGYYKF